MFDNKDKSLNERRFGKLELVDRSPWCTATITQTTITTSVQDGEVKLNGNLNLKVDLDAPAYGSGYVTVKITVPKIGMIEKYGYN